LRNGRSCDGQRRSEINRGERRTESRTTVERTEARNERAGWAARTPDIESEERNAEIGINGDAERKPGCAGKRMTEKTEQMTETETREKTENLKRSHKSGERTTTGIR
jgi:hypothetical protein